MIVDGKHVKWAAATGVGALSFLACAIYASLSANRPCGGSLIGLFFGSVAAGIFVFECLLSLRKRFATSKVATSKTGSVQAWLRAHIWLGILSFLLVFVHSGFRWGHGLAAVLMCLLLIVVVSGVTGVAFQNYLPRRMTELVQQETIFEQIPHVIKEHLYEDADRHVKSVTDASAKAILDTRWKQEISPYLTERPPASSVKLFSTREAIRKYFDVLREKMPFAARNPVKALEDICEERRQLAVQRRLHHWMHGWLFIHVPLSFGLLVLTVVHAVLALRY